MIPKTSFLFGLSMLAMASPAAARECARSPESVLELCVSVEGGEARYEVKRGDVTVIAPSRLGLRFAGEAEPRFSDVGHAKRTSVHTSWEQPWGEQRLIRDHHTELTVTLAGDTALNKAVGVTFRLFDDGFGFRYDYAGVPTGQAVAVTADRYAIPHRRRVSGLVVSGAGPGTRRISLHADRRAAHHPCRDAADAEGR
jgi:alpha-glucosidase